MNWTPPICRGRYAQREPGRDPVRLKTPEQETCCVCGHVTMEGIYCRVDPRTVRYPRDQNRPVAKRQSG